MTELDGRNQMIQTQHKSRRHSSSAENGTIRSTPLCTCVSRRQSLAPISTAKLELGWHL